MRLSYHKTHFLIAGTILLLAACEKDKIEPKFNDAILKGTIYYYGDTYPYTNPPLSDVTVKANGPYGSRTAVTNVKGEYEIKNMGNGTYDIEFLKKGWGATKYYSVQIYGNEVVTYNQRMWKYPEFAMPVLKSQTKEYDEGWVTLQSNLPVTTTETPNLRAFFSRTSDVSCFKYDFTTDVFDYVTTDLHYYYFRLMPTPRPKSVFIVLYLTDPGDNGAYDAYRALMVFPSINPEKHSQVIEYKIP